MKQMPGRCGKEAERKTETETKTKPDREDSSLLSPLTFSLLTILVPETSVHICSLAASTIYETSNKGTARAEGLIN